MAVTRGRAGVADAVEKLAVDRRLPYGAARAAYANLCSKSGRAGELVSRMQIETIPAGPALMHLHPDMMDSYEALALRSLDAV
jgi:hypothetical protein